MSGLPRVDFSRGAHVYDGRHGALISPDLVRRLMTAANLPSRASLLDVGAGTGRVAIPIAATGRRVAAVDPSRAMLAGLSEKASAGPVEAVVGEAGHLPFATASFDAVIFARVLYLLRDWRAASAEAVRVLNPAGAILHEWGNGDSAEEWVQIREQARLLFERAGVAEPFHPGVRQESQVEAVFAAHGFQPCADIVEPVTGAITLAEFLQRIVAGECSYTWEVPAGVQARCLPELRQWAEARFDLDQPRTIPREIRWRVYRRIIDRR
jgi:ubiquinone/menaquinone biosynthesis C-methylase UbiE